LTEPHRLRPLRIGEMLDRAVDVSVRNFPALAAVYLVFSAPAEILPVLFNFRRVDLVQRILDAVSQHGSNLPAEQLAPVGWIHFYHVALWLLAVYVRSALIVAVSARYLGKSASFGAAYRTALRRLLPLVGIDLVYLAFLILELVFAYALLVMLFATHFSPAAVTVAGFVCFVLLEVAVLATLGTQIAYRACLFESANVIGSIMMSVRRILGEHRFTRSLFASNAYAAVVLTATIFSVLTEHEFFSSAIQSEIIRVAVKILVSIASGILCAAFATTFYYDARVRDDGVNLIS
jgi:hypothetical protein